MFREQSLRSGAGLMVLAALFVTTGEKTTR